MLRGARIDLEESKKSIGVLKDVYVRDLESRELSDEMIASVNTIVRSLEGALGKIANEVGKQFAPRRGRGARAPRGPYFPLTDDAARFSALLEGELTGLADNYPDIAAAIERQQPYNPGYAVLARLKMLYRENHHHDFTLQETRQTQTQDFMIGGMILMSMGPHGMTLGGPPEWRASRSDSSRHLGQRSTSTASFSKRAATQR